jgi:hypothetical protein
VVLHSEFTNICDAASETLPVGFFNPEIFSDEARVM